METGRTEHMEGICFVSRVLISTLGWITLHKQHFRTVAVGKGRNLHLLGMVPKGGFTHIMARGSDAVSSAKENSLADFLEMALDLLKPFQLESNTLSDIHWVSLQERYLPCRGVQHEDSAHVSISIRNMQE